MEPYEREFYISRICAGYLKYKIDSEISIYIHPLTLDQQYDANEVFIEAYNEALKLYRDQDWVKAIDAFKASDALEDMFPGRKTNPSQIYIPRCEHYRDNPPGDNWDGSWALTKK